MANKCTDGREKVIKEIQDYMLAASNMTEQEAYSFAFRCWQFNFRKIQDGAVVLTKEELKEHDKKLANEIITMFQKMVQNWASADIANDTAKRLRKLYEV